MSTAREGASAHARYHLVARTCVVIAVLLFLACREKPTQPQATVGHFTAVFAGDYSTCAIDRTGGLYCWGRNDSGQLGIGTSLETCADSAIAGYGASTCALAAAAVRGGLDVTSVSRAGLGTCALANAGKAYCWGAGWIVPGDTSSTVPVVVPAPQGFASITGGFEHVCTVGTNGVAYCWGTGYTMRADTPQVISGGLNFRSVTAGAYHTCGLTVDSKAYCWGLQTSGDLGTGDGALSDSMPVRVSGALTFASVNSFAYHTCGLTAGGAAYCWGDDSFNQLATVNATAGCGMAGGSCSPTPVPSAAGMTFVAISPGGWHTCALASGGVAYCWGRGREGQLGNGSFSDSPTPVRAAAPLTFQAISAGWQHTCGIAMDGRSYCWGENAFGQLGDGTITSRATAILIAGQ